MNGCEDPATVVGQTSVREEGATYSNWGTGANLRGLQHEESCTYVQQSNVPMSTNTAVAAVLCS